MSDDEKPKRKSNKRRSVPPFKVVRSGKASHVATLEAPSKTTVEALYMASKHIEWTPFAESMGWDPEGHRRVYPVAEWIQKKKSILAIQQSESIGEMLWDHRGTWHRDVLKTLREYPGAHDAMLGLLKHRMNEMIHMVNDDQRRQVEHARSGNPEPFKPSFSKIKTGELYELSLALKTVTEGKHKSLMIDQWSVKGAEGFTDPKQFEVADQKAKDTEWKIEIIGQKDMTLTHFEELAYRYYDQKPPRQILAEAKAKEEAEAVAEKPPEAT